MLQSKTYILGEDFLSFQGRASCPPLKFPACLSNYSFLYILSLCLLSLLEAGSLWVSLTALAHNLGTKIRMTEQTGLIVMRLKILAGAKHHSSEQNFFNC